MNRAPTRAGKLYIIGLGPGAPGLLAPDAAAALERADVVVGYEGYLAQIADRIAGKTLVGRTLGEEVERARLALAAAHEGHTVALVSSGDAGVYGMGGVAFELAAERGAEIAIEVVPGITAACAAAAKLGAPLAHDWACVSLSDLLTPWETIVARVDAAAQADFVLVVYNPASRGRPQHLQRVAERLMRTRAAATPVGLVENAFRMGERVEIATLGDLASGRVSINMFTIAIIGNSRTFVARGKMITPRIYAAKERPKATEKPSLRTLGERIMAESFAIIDRELGPEPADPCERALVRRMIHASADFDFARTLRLGTSAIDCAVAALRAGAVVLCDVEMLRSGIRRDLAEPLGVEAICALNNPATAILASEQDLTRSAAGIQLAAKDRRKAIVAIGNAPTALEESLRLVREEGWLPACVIGLPVGFVGVEAAKQRLADEGLRSSIPFITNEGRKGGTAVTAAVVNALLELAAEGGPSLPEPADGP